MAEILKKLNEGEYSLTEAEEIYHGVCDIFTGLLWPDEGQERIREYTEAEFALREFKKLTENMPELSSKDEKKEKIIAVCCCNDMYHYGFGPEMGEGKYSRLFACRYQGCCVHFY